MSDQIERRFFSTELRMEGEGDHRTIVGYGAVFNQLSEEMWGFREMIMPGAFADQLSEDVRSLFNHDNNLILGRTLAGTLRLIEDEVGLRYTVDPPDTQYAHDLQTSIDRGDVNQSSFGFRAIEESWVNPDENTPHPTRKLIKVRLYDVGPVTFPAYPTTSADVRSQVQKIQAAGGVDTPPASAVELSARRLAYMKRQLDIAKRRTS